MIWLIFIEEGKAIYVIKKKKMERAASKGGERPETMKKDLSPDYLEKNLTKEEP